MTINRGSSKVINFKYVTNEVHYLNGEEDTFGYFKEVYRYNYDAADDGYDVALIHVFLSEDHYIYEQYVDYQPISDIHKDIDYSNDRGNLNDEPIFYI